LVWNLIAGVFVLRGGYHAPTQAEQELVETDLADSEFVTAQSPATSLVTE